MSLQRKQPARPPRETLPLIRPQALTARREPLHGQVLVAMPPSAPAAALLALCTLFLLGLAAWLVELPQRAQAVGVLMPPGGLVRVVADQPGRVTALHAREGARVEEGESLMRVTSDAGAVGADSVAQARLDSLRHELALQDDVARKARLAQEGRGRARDEQIAQLSLEQQRAADEVALHDARVELLQRRLARVRSLASGGNVAGVQLEDARLAWLEARAAAESLRRQSLRLEQEAARLAEARAALLLEAAQEEVEHAIARERLLRQLPDVEAQVERELRAPRTGVVARVMARPGQAVATGQTLATIHPGSEKLEAWLYLPSAQAGWLQEGQAVELRFDAWPSGIFGTQPATIASISAIALMPADLDVPLALTGPVFEIRARLERQSVAAAGREWSLAAGTAVRADLVQQRYRLYEWLLRLKAHARTGSMDPADA